MKVSTDTMLFAEKVTTMGELKRRIGDLIKCKSFMK